MDHGCLDELQQEESLICQLSAHTLTYELLLILEYDEILTVKLNCVTMVSAL